MDTLIEHLALCIRYHRKRSKLSQADLAKLAGIGKTAVFDIEHGKETVQIDTLLKILNVLNIKMKLASPLMQEFEESLNATS